MKTMIRVAVVVAAMVFGSAWSASAAPIFFDNFDQEALATNTTLDNWTVTRGTVDVVGTGFFDLCTSGPSPSRCVDLDGSSFQAARIESVGINLLPGTYEFSFWLRGNARNATNDTVRMIVETGVTPGESFTLNGADPWQQYVRTFTLSAPQTVNLVFDHAGGDNIGILLDNVSLNAVPEPASMFLLATGLVGLGARLRRRA